MPKRKFKYKTSMRFKRRYKHTENIAAVLVAFFIIIVGFVALFQFFSSSGKKINIPIENVSNFKIPHKNLPVLKTLAAKYGIDFSELVTIYSLEQNFFPSKSQAVDAAEIERSFLINYDSIRKSYKPKELAPYYNMLNTLFEEIKYFPIPSGYDNEESPSYMFGDNFNLKNSKTTDIIDRENIRGRIPIMSLGGGTVESIGLKEDTGFQIKIKTSQETIYTYSYLDSVSDGLVTGSLVQPGQLLGFMGAVQNIPVRLAISISPKFALTSKEFFINPYPFLRSVEATRAEYKPQ